MALLKKEKLYDLITAVNTYAFLGKKFTLISSLVCFYFLAHGDGGSPFAAPTSTSNLSMSSPAPGAWPGSPSVPRPSPRPTGTAQSPGSSNHPALHSPQAGALTDHSKAAGKRGWCCSLELPCIWEIGVYYSNLVIVKYLLTSF